MKRISNKEKHQRAVFDMLKAYYLGECEFPDTSDDKLTMQIRDPVVFDKFDAWVKEYEAINGVNELFDYFCGDIPNTDNVRFIQTKVEYDDNGNLVNVR